MLIDKKNSNDFYKEETDPNVKNKCIDLEDKITYPKECYQELFLEFSLSPVLFLSNFNTIIYKFMMFTNNRKIKIATATDDPKNIIGIVSVAPFILAGTAVFDWGDMYLTDVWGSLLLDSSNNKIINPKYNPNLTYLPREERKEWTKIGLIGILKLLKGQPVHPNWIKIRDINDEIEEWFIR